jgi:pimeloyl-ACP methyl ester carboxylesterase
MTKTDEIHPHGSGRGRLWWTKVILGGGAALAAIALLLLLLAGARAKASIRAEYPPSGQLVDVGGYDLHIHCEGEGSPAVILEAGAGAFSPHWVYVQEETAQFTRVCAYDRAGLGWSEVSPHPRTAGVVVEELHTLLTEAGVAGPYVLVGHSLGGLYVRHYAHEFPEEVAGLVLVDAAHTEQQRRAPAAYREWDEAFQAQTAQQFALGRLLSAGGVMALDPTTVPSDPHLPPEKNETFRAIVAANPDYFSSVGAVYGNLEQLFAEARAAGGSLDDLPLVVIARGEALEADPAIGLTPELAAQYEPVWRQLQAELAELSTCGELVIAEESGHNIQLEQPEVVVGAIREVVKTTKDDRDSCFMDTPLAFSVRAR